MVIKITVHGIKEDNRDITKLRVRDSSCKLYCLECPRFKKDTVKVNGYCRRSAKKITKILLEHAVLEGI